LITVYKYLQESLTDLQGPETGLTLGSSPAFAFDLAIALALALESTWLCSRTFELIHGYV